MIIKVDKERVKVKIYVIGIIISSKRNKITKKVLSRIYHDAY